MSAHTVSGSPLAGSASSGPSALARPRSRESSSTSVTGAASGAPNAARRSAGSRPASNHVSAVPPGPPTVSMSTVSAPSSACTASMRCAGPKRDAPGARTARAACWLRVRVSGVPHPASTDPSGATAAETPLSGPVSAVSVCTAPKRIAAPELTA